MEASIYNTKGDKAGSIALPEDVFDVKWQNALMYQVVTTMQANARTPVAHVKTRGDVRGGGKKPWQQKGTGRARHGSIRSPIWKGGGVTHGPLKEKVYARAIPKKMRAKALFMALSRKFKDGEIIFVDRFSMQSPKTKDAITALRALAKVEGFSKLATKSHNTALIALSEKSDPTEKSFRNVGSVALDLVANLNPVSVLKYKYLVIENPSTSIPVIEKRARAKTKN
ncbi:50S ribosomal protein L4 [Candidatus Kaiserbacteria bacterium]|nr:50S ribosomal protein L4 [Candidatus Kaiserbacteria bacterium]